MRTNIDINNATGSQLVEIYNNAARALGRDTVNRFSDRATAIKRVKKIVGELPVVDSEVEGRLGFDGKMTLVKKAKAKPARAPRMTFSFPLCKTTKRLREGTKRAAIFDALKSGATFEQVQEVVKAFDKQHPPARARTEESLKSFTYEAIRLLHLYCGFGLEERDGKIYVLGEK